MLFLSVNLVCADRQFLYSLEHNNSYNDSVYAFSDSALFSFRNWFCVFPFPVFNTLDNLSLYFISVVIRAVASTRLLLE